MRITGILAEKGLHTFDKEERVHAGHVIPRIWAIVADKEKAHIYRKTPHGLELIADIEARHTSHHHHNKHHEDEYMFGGELAEWLEAARGERVFDRLVLVAKTRTLAALRESLSPSLQACVSAELDKDLTKMGQRDLEHALEKSVCF